MATFIDDVPEVVSEIPKPGTRHPVATPPWAHRLPSSPRSPIFSLAVPMLYAAMGISLGTLAGVCAAFATMPAGAESASNQSAPSSTPSAQTPSRQITSSDLSANSQPAAAVPAFANLNTLPSDATDSKADRVTSAASPANPPVKDLRPAEALAVSSPEPQVEGNPPNQSASAQKSQVKSAARPTDLTADTDLANAADAQPVSLDQQLNSVDEAKSWGSYSEGDLTVADYDATAGTILASDGRTFVLGTTVGVNDASSWQDYRSNVHYKCGQNGSCMLTRHGAVAPNAKLIDRARSEDSGLSQGF
jgi:hypothetical protein